MGSKFVGVLLGNRSSGKGKGLLYLGFGFVIHVCCYYQNVRTRVSMLDYG